MLAKISDEQVAALRAYANENGRTWKSKLLTEWMNASAPPILHRIRNSHGPTWLTKFKFDDYEKSEQVKSVAGGVSKKMETLVGRSV